VKKTEVGIFITIETMVAEIARYNGVQTFRNCNMRAAN
jgi:hypothetical protein